MASGWESLIRVTPCNGWQSPGTLGRRGLFLFVDSESLDYGAQFKEYDQKLLGVREVPSTTFSITQYQPKGPITFQPRVDDILPILMSHFQNCVKSGTGTYIFSRLPISPDFGSTGAGVFSVGYNGTIAGTGTNAYGINLDLIFANSLSVGTKANGIRFTSGFADSLTFSQKYNEALQVTCDFKFNEGSLYAYPTTFLPLTAYGSMSESNQFVDYLATVALTGRTWEIDSYEGKFVNNSGDKTKLGKRGFVRFPFGRYVADGSFDLELQDDLAVTAAGQSGSLTANFYIGTDCRITVDYNNIIYRPTTPNVNGPDMIKFSQPFRAYPPSGTTGPSAIVTVCCGTNFGTGLFGF
jgi:hypothetical protein